MDTKRIRSGAVRQVYTINPARAISILDGDGSTTHDLTFLNGMLSAYASAGGVAGWWLSGGVTQAQCVAAYQPRGAASYAASKVNLNNPGVNDAVDGVAFPTLDATGWLFDGTQYLDTGILPLASTWSYIVYCHIAGGYLFGNSDLMDTGWEVTINPATLSPGVYYSHASNATIGDDLVTGTVGIANRTCYRNGTPEGVLGAPISLPFANSIYIGATNDAMFGASSLLAGYILAIAIYNITLSDAQMLAISNAMLAL